MSQKNGNQASLGWNDKSKDDPSVIQLRRHLEANSGIKGLEIVKPDDIETAIRLFRRDGFVVVENVLNDDQISILASGCDQLIKEITDLDRQNIGNRGSHRYSFGGSSLTRSQLHRPEWQRSLIHI